MEEGKKGNKGVIWIFIICIVVGIAGGIALGVYSRKAGFDFDSSLMIWGLVFTYLWVFISINLHELGHLIFGLLGKFKLVSYSILCFNFVKENERLKFYIKSYKDIGGLCAMIPTEETSKKQLLLNIAGGCLFNFITVFLLLFVIIFIPIESFYLKLFLGIGIGISLVAGVLNSIPMAKAGVISDGYMFNIIFKDSPKGSKLVEMNNILGRIKRGTRYKDLGLKEDFSDEDNIIFVDIQYLIFRYFQELENNNMEEVKKIIGILEENLELIPLISQQGIYQEFIYYYSVIDFNREKAKSYFKKVEKMLIKDMDINGRRVLSAYYAFVHGDKNKAEECAREGLMVKDKYPLKGQSYLEESLILDTLDKIN